MACDCITVETTSEVVSIETTTLDEVIQVGVVGPQGPTGATGGAGVGVPTGGITGYVLAKASTADYDTEWIEQTPIVFGTGAGEVTEGNDSRIANIRSTSINTLSGGSITTSNDGGSINTTGTGAIGFGTQGTRTTLVGTATTTRNISLPDTDGTLVLLDQDVSFTGLTVNGTAVAGQTPDSALLGGLFIGSPNGSIGVGVYEETSFGANAITFTGFNQNVTGYNDLMFTAGPSPQFYLDTGGNVGVGLVAPAAKLDVNGNLIIRDTENETTATFDAQGAITSDRAYTLPNASGTLALITQSTDYEVTDSARGIILKSPNNTRWRITINNDGTLSRVALALMSLLAFATSGFAQVRDMVTDTNGNIVTGRTNVLTFTNSVNIPIYSGAATTNSILSADGAGGSSFVVNRTVTRFTTNDQTRTNWGFNFVTQASNNDPQIGSFAIDANSVYRVDFVVAFRAASNASFRCGVGFATNLADINQRAGFFQAASTILTAINAGTNGTSMAIQGDPAGSTNHTIAGLFYIYSGTNANTMFFRWYPANNTNVACNLLSNTMFSVTKMAP
jgi:hypothetical protein